MLGQESSSQVFLVVLNPSRRMAPLPPGDMMLGTLASLLSLDLLSLFFPQAPRRRVCLLPFSLGAATRITLRVTPLSHTDFSPDLRLFLQSECDFSREGRERRNRRNSGIMCQPFLSVKAGPLSLRRRGSLLAFSLALVSDQRPLFNL